MNKKIKWQTPELIEVIGKNTGANCAYGNNPATCTIGRIPQDGICSATGTQAAGSCSTGDSVQ